MRFAERDNLKMLTAIGNDGHIYAIEKTKAFNKAAFMDKVIAINEETDRVVKGDDSKLNKLEKIDIFIRNQLKDISEYGAKYHE